METNDARILELSGELAESVRPLEASPQYVVQAWNGKTWRKVRGIEGGPWDLRSRAERIAQGRQDSPRKSSSTEGMPHRVIEVTNNA